MDSPSTMRAINNVTVEIFQSLATDSALVDDSVELLSQKDLGELQYLVHVTTEFSFFLESVIERTDFPSAWDNDARYCSYPMARGMPCYNEVDYAIGTIQSAIPSLVRIYDVYHLVDDARPCEVKPKDFETFSVFKRTYAAKFLNLRDRSLPFGRRLGHLVELGKMQVCFLGFAL